MKSILALLLAATISGPSFACDAIYRQPSVAEEVEQRLCSGGVPGTVFRMEGLAGQRDPDLLRLGLALNGIERSVRENRDIGEDGDTLAATLARNNNVRTGLRIVLLQAMFSPTDLTLWCEFRTRDRVFTSSETERIAPIDEAVECELAD